MDEFLKNKYSIALGSGLLLLAFFIHATNPQADDKFTTNIDLKNKIINDTVVDTSESDIASPLINHLLEDGQKWLSINFNIWRFYQNMANPSSRYIVLNSGLRKEEVANVLQKELKWDTKQKNSFINMDKLIHKKNMEGRYSPGSYLIPSNTKPAEAYKAIMDKFTTEISAPYASSSANIINMDLALKIASIIEREAAGTRDMRLISGVIWNRIFSDMNLEMDATLQYAKGSHKNGWWPKVNPKDKYIDSPYNTYQNSGLPPTPISNISTASLHAALNPKKTDCIFYLHDRHGLIHCAVTYKEHQANITKYYGK